MIQPTEQPIHHGRVAGAPSRGAARAALWLLACGLFGLGSTAQGQTAYPPAANLSSGNYLYWGSPSVISNYSFAVSGSAAVSFMASGSIVLNNGFSATAGAWAGLCEPLDRRSGNFRGREPHGEQLRVRRGQHRKRQHRDRRQ